MTTLSERQAIRRGYRLTRGAYSGTSDDRIDRWYWTYDGEDSIDRRGSGFVTKRDALKSLSQNLAMLED